MHFTAKLEAVTRLLEKLTGDLEKNDLTTDRQCLLGYVTGYTENVLLTLP